MSLSDFPPISEGERQMQAWEEDPTLWVAANGSVNVPELIDEVSLECAERIISIAPDSIQDDFKRCCSYYIYRSQLLKAIENNDAGQIFMNQSALDDFH